MQGWPSTFIFHLLSPINNDYNNPPIHFHPMLRLLLSIPRAVGRENLCALCLLAIFCHTRLYHVTPFRDPHHMGYVHYQPHIFTTLQPSSRGQKLCSALFEMLGHISFEGGDKTKRKTEINGGRVFQSLFFYSIDYRY